MKVPYLARLVLFLLLQHAPRPYFVKKKEVAPVSAIARDGLTNMCKAWWGTLSVDLEVFDMTTVVLSLLNTLTQAVKCKGVGYDGVEKAIT
jgi:hypothetical protein